MCTWIAIANTEKRRELFGEKKTIEEVGQMIPWGVLTWCFPGSVDPKDSSLLDLRIPRTFSVAEHGSHQ